MNILAIIPARAGSKGIPNKNIRIVSGHPLVYYSINTAKKSKYITNIIVTTDSDAVKTIALQMGVNVKNRNKKLCGDDITLDAVVFDAIPDDKEWDYIITMQPTSPTLTVNTLDKAIKHALDNSLDTLISAINKPHLSWTQKDGSFVPNYKERLNRQYLPPYYEETGAFVISRSSVVTEKTRIGKKVAVYEIPEQEAHDIDDFADLQSAELSLSAKRVAFYVNGNNKRGTGHIYRALELADEFYCKPDIYFDINQTESRLFGNTTHNIVPVNGIYDLYEKCRNKKYNLFINDILSTSIDYMIGLKSILPSAKIVNFEDDGEGATVADLVFNALYSNDGKDNVFCGEKYYICSKYFLFYKPITIKDDVRNVFICFGGADPQNYTDRILQIIAGNEEYSRYNFVVVLGKAKNNIRSLMEYNRYDNITVLFDAQNMPELMSSCDIGITSRGRTGYELAMLGIPSIAMAQNQREEKHGFVSDENGFSYLGLNPSDEIIKGTLDMYLRLSKSSRSELQKKLLEFDLRNGRKRVMSLIDNLN